MSVIIKGLQTVSNVGKYPGFCYGGQNILIDHLLLKVLENLIISAFLRYRNITGNLPAINLSQKSHKQLKTILWQNLHCNSERNTSEQRIPVLTPMTQTASLSGKYFLLFFFGSFFHPLKQVKIQKIVWSKGMAYASWLTSHLLNAAECTQVAGGGGLLQKLQKNTSAAQSEQCGDKATSSFYWVQIYFPFPLHSWLPLPVDGLKVPRVGGVNSY